MHGADGETSHSSLVDDATGSGDRSTVSGGPYGMNENVQRPRRGQSVQSALKPGGVGGAGKRSAPGASDRHPHGPRPQRGLGSPQANRARAEGGVPNPRAEKRDLRRRQGRGSIPARVAEDGSAETDWGGDVKRASALVDWYGFQPARHAQADRIKATGRSESQSG